MICKWLNSQWYERERSKKEHTGKTLALSRFLVTNYRNGNKKIKERELNETIFSFKIKIKIRTLWKKLLAVYVFVNGMKNCEVIGSPQGREGTKAREGVCNWSWKQMFTCSRHLGKQWASPSAQRTGSWFARAPEVCVSSLEVLF